MKKILWITASFLFVILITNLANRVPADGTPGTSFNLKAQRVVACSDKEIILVDPHETATRLDKDASWPECGAFQVGQTQDFYLSRGEKTHFVSLERTSWWRKAI